MRKAWLAAVLVAIVILGAGVAHADFDSLLNEARDAYMNGKFALSADKAEDALKLKPKDQHAEAVATLASCKLKQVDRARLHYKNLSSATRREQARQICAGSGVTLQ